VFNENPVISVGDVEGCGKIKEQAEGGKEGFVQDIKQKVELFV
jgi:hypothetical protein